MTVLLVEDSDGDALIMEELLEGERTAGRLDLRRVGRLDEALEAVRAERPDCLLLDLGLPDASGLDGLTELLAVVPDLPVVVLTGADDPDLPGLALREGAQDYLVKRDTLTDEVLLRTIRYATDRVEQIRVLQASRAQLKGFAHQVAHDLKSPLTTVLGALEILRERSSADDVELIEVARRAVGRLTEMVDRLLGFAEEAGTEGILTDVDLDEIVDWALSHLEVSLAEADVVVDRPLGRVVANRTALQHVALNVLSNAVKYAEPGRELRLRLRAELDDGVVRLEFGDNGIGIPTERRRDVFEDGVQVKSSDAGTGLGLATVRRTVRLFGGQVFVADGPDGVGTTIVVELPIASGAAPG